MRAILWGRTFIVAGLVTFGLGIAAVPAAAEQVTLGVADPQLTNADFGAGTVIQTALPGGDTVAVPGAGRIVEWWAIGRGTDVSAALRVVHTTMTGQFTAEQTSGEQPLHSVVVLFPTNLPVQSGDLIGVTIDDGDGQSGVAFSDADMNSAVRTFTDAFPDGSTEAGALVENHQLQMGAQFVYTPIVTAVAASSGSTSGGQVVVITGDHLTDSSIVRFGLLKAAHFTIVSNTQIIAVAPAAAAGTVDVTVGGAGGTSDTSASDDYTFVTPLATVGPPSLDFGSELVGGASATHTVTLANTGSVPVAVGASGLTGADAADFTRFSDSCADQTVAPGASCSVTLLFTPTATGARTATLTVDDDAAGGPHRVTLTGTGASSTPTGASSTPTGTGAPSNAFSIGRLRGTTLTVTVASHGTVLVTAVPATRRHKPLLLRPSRATGGKGLVRVTLHLSNAALALLKREHLITLKLKVTFTPTVGPAVSKSVTLVFRRNRA